MIRGPYLNWQCCDIKLFTSVCLCFGFTETGLILAFAAGVPPEDRHTVIADAEFLHHSPAQPRYPLPPLYAASPVLISRAVVEALRFQSICSMPVCPSHQMFQQLGGTQPSV